MTPDGISPVDAEEKSEPPFRHNSELYGFFKTAIFTFRWFIFVGGNSSRSEKHQVAEVIMF